MKFWGLISRVRFVVVLACVSTLVMFGLSTSGATAAPLPIKHVWIITLENESAPTTFGGGSPAHYLNNTLRPKGVFVPNYYGTGHASLDNYIAMVSGQGANPMTQGDCPIYINVLPGTKAPNGQSTGMGCVYPKSVLTIGDQMENHGLTWKEYAQDMGNTLSREAATCAHPALNSQDGTESATAQDNYATRHNGFMYFHSIIDEPSCNTNVVPLGKTTGGPLVADLGSATTTPTYSFITPSLCEDGHDAPCADGRPGGLVSADAFLATWVPKILGSDAYAEGGMLIVNVDEAATSDASACCGEGPNPYGLTPVPGITGFGGGRTGAVIVSSRTNPGTTTNFAYNHFSMLKSVENLFGFPHLGYANTPNLRAFGADIYSAG